jgi:hypothetical protein
MSKLKQLELNFGTKYVREKDIGEINSGEIITNKVLMFNAQQIVSDMMRAGVRLMNHRALNQNADFKADEEVPDDYIDPTRNKNFDMADATALENHLNNKVKMTKKEIEEFKEMWENEKKKKEEQKISSENNEN